MDRTLIKKLMAFYNNQKIGVKILIGYLVILALVIFVGGLAIFQLDRVSHTINDLTLQLTHELSLAEKNASQMHLIRLYANQYIFEGQKPADLTSYNQALADAQNFLDEGEQAITSREHAVLWTQMRGNFDNFTAAFAEIFQIMAARQEITTNTLVPRGDSCMEKLADLRNTSFETLDFTSANYASQARDTFSHMQVNILQYLNSGNVQFALQADQDDSTIRSTFDLLQASVRSDTSRDLVAQIISVASAYRQGFQDVRTGVVRQQNLVTSQYDFYGTEVDKIAADIVNKFNSEFTAQSQATRELAENTRLIMLGTIMLAIILGLVFSLVLRRSITSPIKRVALAARAIATGAFDQEVSVQSQDELGELADSFNSMADQLRRAFNSLEERISALNQAQDALRASEAFRQRVFESSPVPIVVMDAETYAYIECNPAAVEIYRFASREETLGKTPLDVSAPMQYDGTPSHEKARYYINRALAEGRVVFDWRHQRPNGETWDAEVHLMSFKSGEQQLLQFTLVDITERKRAEEALIESEEKFRNLFVRSGDAVLLLEDGIFFDCNMAAQRLFAMRREEIINHRPEELSPEYQREGVRSTEEAATQIAIATRDGYSRFEWIHRRIDSTLIETEVMLTAIHFEGRPILHAVVRDISKRKQAERKIQEDAERSKTLARIASALNISLDLQNVMDTVCREIALALDVPLTTIRLVDEVSNNLVIRSLWGLSVDDLTRFQPFPDRFYERFPQVYENIYLISDVRDLTGSPNNDLYSEFGITNIFVCRLVHDERLQGTLNLAFREQRVFSDDDLVLLKTLSGQVTIALYNAWLYEQVIAGRERLQALSEELVDIQETERRNLAIELHDEIGQALTLIKMNLDLYQSDLSEKRDYLKTVKDLTIELMQRVRSLSLELRPAVLDDLGLLPAVLWHIERYTSLTQIEVDIKPSDVNRRFNPQVESTAYRVLQESLTNIARHSRATRVTVSLWADDERLGMQIEDNGAGFNVSEVLVKRTGGLSGMQERAHMCGGQLEIDSSPGQGTYISLELPLKSEYLERRKR